MFNLLLRFEALYQLKQRALPLMAGLFLFLGFLAASNGYAPANVNINASYQINNHFGLFSLGSVFIVMFFAISGTLRDGRFKMDMLVYSSSVEKIQFYWSRFLGVFVFSLLAFSPFILGMMAGHLLKTTDPSRLAPFNLLNYLQPWLIITVPNIFMCSAVLFVVSLLTRSQVATYVGAVFIYMFYMICSMFFNSPLMAQSVPASPEAMGIAALADPFGISAFFEQTQFWTPYQKNYQLLSFSGYFLWNRIIWVGTSILLLFSTYYFFSFSQLNRKVKKVKTAAMESMVNVFYKAIEPTRGFLADRTSLFSIVKMELNGVVKSIPFIAVMLIWLVIMITEIYSRMIKGGQYGDSFYPLTHFIVEHIVDPLRALSLILIVFYSGELVWRERFLNFNGIVDATPVSNWVFFIGKLMALLLLPSSLIASGIVVGAAFQLTSGFFSIDLGQYLAVFYFYGWQLFIFSVLGVFVQSIVRNKYLGMGITGVLILGSFLSGYIGIEHPMLRFGFLPNVNYTDMTGFAGESLEFAHFAVYWLGVSGILALVSFKLWQRGTSATSFKKSDFIWKKGELALLTFFGIVLLAGGGTVFYNTNVVNEYLSSTSILDYKETYEKQFKQYDALAPLYNENVNTKVDLYPKENSYRIEANNIMVNREDTAVTRVFVTARTPLESIEVESAQLVMQDAEFDTYLFQLDKPLPPKGKVKVHYVINYQQKGYEVDKAIVENGTYIAHRSFVPHFGYRTSLEIKDNFEREKRNLPKVEDKKEAGEHIHYTQIKYSKIEYETVVSTIDSEVALASGELMREWTENGRNYYHFKAKDKIIPTTAYFSSAYATQKEQHKGISIEQYYYPKHYYNIDSVASSIKATLDYCIANFGNYPFNHVRIAEIPSHWPFGGFAHPGVISMVEDRLYLTDIREANRFNLVAKRTIHEVAHQWWGHVITPKIAVGGALFVEGFAKYTEAVIMDELYGKYAIHQLSKTASRRYFQGRAWASEPEPPLYQEVGENYLAYGKSYTVMLGLRSLVGEEKVNQVLKTLVDRHKNDEEFSVNSIEFLDELYKVSPEKYHQLIDDWFKKVITYNLSIDKVSHEKLSNGQFEMSITVNAKRFEMQESGEEKAIGINEPIEVGLFNHHPDALNNQHTVPYLKSHQITKDKQVIKIITNELPQYISIDPFGTRVDENIFDNTLRYEGN